MVDNNPEAWEVIQNRLGNATLALSVEYLDFSKAEQIDQTSPLSA